MSNPTAEALAAVVAAAVVAALRPLLEELRAAPAAPAAPAAAAPAVPKKRAPPKASPGPRSLYAFFTAGVKARHPAALGYLSPEDVQALERGDPAHALAVAAWPAVRDLPAIELEALKEAFELARKEATAPE